MCAQVLAWLCCKLRRLRSALAGHSAAHAAMDEASLTAYSVRLLGEYLPEPWLQRLCEACDVPAVPGVAFLSPWHTTPAIAWACAPKSVRALCSAWVFLRGAEWMTRSHGAMHGPD
jgi:hypothetical protein